VKASSLVHWAAGVSQNTIADAAVIDAGKSAVFLLDYVTGAGIELVLQSG